LNLLTKNSAGVAFTYELRVEKWSQIITQKYLDEKQEGDTLSSGQSA
jgi:hypothetical protein